MQPDVKDDESIRAYLLGAELPADTQDGIEQRLIADDDYFERVRSIEDEIIDSYLGGELTSDEVGLFRHHFLRSSRHQERLRLYESWTRAGARQQNSQRRLPGSPPEITSWWKLMVAAMSKHRSLALVSGLAVFLVVSGFWVTRRIVALQVFNQRLSSQLAEERGARTRLEQQVGGLSHEHGEMIASFVLTPPGTRGGGRGKSSSTIAIKPGAQVLRLELLVPYEAEGFYSVVIETVDGKESFRQDDLAARAAGSAEIVDVLLPADLLPENDYVVTLRQIQVSGELQKVGSFSFRLLRD